MLAFMPRVNDVFVHDIVLGTTEKASKCPCGTDEDEESGRARLNANGTAVAFDSYAKNLLVNLGDTNQGGTELEVPEGRNHFAKINQRQRSSGNWAAKSEIMNNLIRDFNVIRHKAGVDKCTLHDLRRSAITIWAGNLPIQVVQQLAGHSDIWPGSIPGNT